jgi:osmoprotectant transport system permease protein
VFGFVDYIRNNPDQYVAYLTRHLYLVGSAVLLATVIGIPLAVLATRVRWLAAPLTWLANFGQTIPSLALLALTLPVLGIGVPASIVALTVSAILPIFLNTYVGIRGLLPQTVDAARGMGASNMQQLFLIDLPLASPVIWNGLQTAAVQTVAAAALAAFIGGGGLGELIVRGLTRVIFDSSVLLAGAVTVAALALLVDLVMRWLRRFVVPKGLQIGRH